MSDTAPAEPSVFTKIIRGDFPGRFVWRDDDVVAFLTIAPMRPGHTLVVPVEQIDHWIDLSPELWARVAEVQLAIGRAQMAAFSPVRVGMIIAGLEVPHCHLHVVPIDSESDLDFRKADGSPDPAMTGRRRRPSAGRAPRPGSRGLGSRLTGEG